MSHPEAGEALVTQEPGLHHALRGPGVRCVGAGAHGAGLRGFAGPGSGLTERGSGALQGGAGGHGHGAGPQVVDATEGLGLRRQQLWERQEQGPRGQSWFGSWPGPSVAPWGHTGRWRPEPAPG